jgi:hypothetical protein
LARYINPASQYFDNSGNVLSGGTIDFYQSGTNTRLNTYADSTFDTLNTNPVVLDAAGRIPNVFYEGSAKVVIRSAAADCNSTGTLISEDDPVGGEQTTGELAFWESIVTYSLNSIVQGSDNKFYISLQAANINHDPTTPAPTWWSEIRFLGVYNASKSYSIGDVVQDSTGALWASQSASNLANTPSSDSGTNWLPAINGLWKNKAANFTVIPNIKYTIDGSSSTVDGALPVSLAAGDIITAHNASDSTNLVRLTNTALTIKGPSGTVTSSDNLELGPGDTAVLVAVSTNILEVV